MIASSILITVLALTAIVVAYVGGTYCVLFLSRNVRARTQHREGLRTDSQWFGAQELTDFFKVSRKYGKHSSRLSFTEYLVFICWKRMPLLFLLILFGRLIPAAGVRGEMLILNFLPLLGVTLEIFMLHMSTSVFEKTEMRRWFLVKILAGLCIILSTLTVAVHFSSLELAQISAEQRAFPFLLMFRGPGIFAAALLSFVSICFLCMSTTQNAHGESALKEERHYDFFVVRAAWIFSFACYWIYVFGGGIGGVVNLVLFPAKLFLFLFFFLFLDSFLVRIRAVDANKVLAKALLPASVASLVVEVIWLGFLL